ncbi:MAG: hypothetical protein LBP50_03215 [Tannerella sp.]|jgi:hypothetical protein|nr:hypothetical protein [Tannerella sp.]
MKFYGQKFGGVRPIVNGTTAIGVVGGFNLDRSKVSWPVGSIIPGGSLAEYDEQTRLVTVLKASRVKAIDGGDAKIVTLDTDFIPAGFAVGDKVLKTVAGTFAAAPSIVKIEDGATNYVITLSAVISGLAVGDALFQVIDDGSGNAALPVSAPQGLTINADVQGTVVGHSQTSVDVTADTKGNMFYKRRIPPIPAEFISGVTLKTNPNILFTESY